MNELKSDIKAENPEPEGEKMNLLADVGYAERTVKKLRDENTGMYLAFQKLIAAVLNETAVLLTKENSRIAELGKQVDALQKYNDGAMDEIDKLEYRITELEANKEKTEHMVELLIQAGNVLADGLDTYWQECYPQALGCWHTLVTEWKEQQ